MRKFYEDMRAHMKYLDKAGLTKDYFAAQNWPKELADRYLQYVEQAYKEIEKWKEEDQAYYRLLARHIKLESMTPRYWLLKYHSTKYTEDELRTMRREFAMDCRELNINRMEECRPIEELIGEWN